MLFAELPFRRISWDGFERFCKGFIDGAVDEIKDKFNDDQITVAHHVANDLKACEHIEANSIGKMLKIVKRGDQSAAIIAVKEGVKYGSNMFINN